VDEVANLLREAGHEVIAFDVDLALYELASSLYLKLMLTDTEL
jgi:hypothetical protein